METISFKLPSERDPDRAANCALDEARRHRREGRRQLARVGAFGRQAARLYLSFEQGLAAARTLLTLEYLLGRGFRVRATGGQDSALGLFYTRSFD